MMNVLLTVDVEVWCGGWDRLDERFSDAFQRYVYGPTQFGCYGLPLELAILRDHGLRGVFFTESLFAARFGQGALQEIVGLIREARQEVQLHLHTEWADEARPIIFKSDTTKRQFIRDFTLDEQVQLIELGSALLRVAGVEGLCAFRAGSWGMGRDTLEAVGKAGLRFDSSFSQSRVGRAHSPFEEDCLLQPVRVGGVIEYPISVMREGGSLRHLQVGACSFEELQSALWAAHDAGWRSVVIYLHSFELMNMRRNAPDWVVVRRYRRLCQFLDRYRDSFRTVWFSELDENVSDHQPELLVVGGYPRAVRLVEQAWRRIRYSDPRRRERVGGTRSRMSSAVV
jgi:hypothetical protein